MQHKLKLCICLCIAVTVITGANLLADAHPVTSLQQVKARAIAYLLGGSGEGPYRQRAIQANDQWVEEQLRAKEQPVVWEESAALIMNVRLNAHAAELRRMAVAFRSEGSRYRGNEAVKQRIIAGMENILQYFNPSSPRPGNWYQWLISLPGNLGATALLMEPDLPPELLDRLRVTLRDQLTEDLVLTGTNAAWESRNHIYLALLDNDSARLQRAAEYVFRTVRYGTEQGVREDYSYLFHGHIPYAGAYGAGFAQTISEFIYVFDGTPYATEPVHLDVVVNLLLEHTRWFLADGQIDLHVRGRTFKSRGSWNAVLEALVVLAQTGSPRSREAANTAMTMLKADPQADLNLTSAGFADMIKTTGGKSPAGFRYWPCSEIGVFKQDAFHIGFRQFSSRVQDYEYLNREDGGEGEEGWNLAYGFTNILREDGKGAWYPNDGKERDMYPEIDLEHLPGTTTRIGGSPVNPKFRADPKRSTMSTTGFSLNFGKSPFAGGAGWGNGGVAGFILEPAYGGFTAKKSLHFFPAGFWALGSSIASTADSINKPVHTTLIQWVTGKQYPVLTLAGGNIPLVKDSTITLRNTQWFWINDEQVAVVFAAPANVFVRLKGKVITAWLDHGHRPTAAGYAYAVLPGSSLAEAKAFAGSLPFRPARMDENVHAVKDVSGQSESIVFFAPDSCLGISVRSPAIVYRKGDNNGGVYTIQDPLHQTTQLKLSVDKLAGKLTSPNPELVVKQQRTGHADIELSSAGGRIYRFGYGTYGETAGKEPRKEMDISSYNDFHVDANSNAERTILTVRLPDEAIKNGYKLSVHYSKSQRLHDFTEADIVDRPSPNVVRYRWNRNTSKGSGVFADYWKLRHGNFKVYLVTELVELVEGFSVPDFSKE